MGEGSNSDLREGKLPKWTAAESVKTEKHPRKEFWY